MGIRLDGTSASKALKANIAARISRIHTKKTPTLSVVLVGNNPASEVFVTIKKKFGADVGINVAIRRIRYQAARSTEQEKKRLKRLIRRLNRDRAVDGILLQLPLPKGLMAQEFINLIDRDKDVDGLRADSPMKSPVGEAVRHLLRMAHKAGGMKGGANQHGVLLVKSDEFARSLLRSLRLFPVEWRVVRVSDRDALRSVTAMKRCGIVVSALGFPHAITPDMIKQHAGIIDVGFTRTKNGGKGDVHPDCYHKTSFYSPVPGGVGPLTVAYVFKNVLKVWRV